MNNKNKMKKYKQKLRNKKKYSTSKKPPKPYDTRDNETTAIVEYTTICDLETGEHTIKEDSIKSLPVYKTLRVGIE